MNCPLCHNIIPSIIARELRRGKKRKVFFCRRCELGILDSKIRAEKLKKFYASEYRQSSKLTSQATPAQLFSTFAPLQSNRLKLLKRYLTKKTKLLEIGCSAGMFLHQVKKHVGEVIGIDFDVASANYAAQKCHCKVYTTDISDTPLQKKYFDVIVAFQTLEHVGDPRQFILSLKEYLAPGGVMVIEVPNLYDALAHVYDLPNHYKFFFHAAHLWYFTEKSLTKLMRDSGFEGEVNHQQDYNILNHFHWIDTDSGDPNSFKRLSPPTLPLRSKRSKEIYKNLNNFILKTDDRYKKLLAKLKITSNITFVGKSLPRATTTVDD